MSEGEVYDEEAQRAGGYLQRARRAQSSRGRAGKAECGLFSKAACMGI